MSSEHNESKTGWRIPLIPKIVISTSTKNRNAAKNRRSSAPDALQAARRSSISTTGSAHSGVGFILKYGTRRFINPSIARTYYLPCDPLELLRQRQKYQFYEELLEDDMYFHQHKGRVLDLGCGTGTWINEQHKRYMNSGDTFETEYVGIDLLNLTVGLDMPPQWKFVETNLSTNRYLPFTDQYFDGIHIQDMSSVFEYSQRSGMKTLWQELHRVLNNGGEMIICEANLTVFEAVTDSQQSRVCNYKIPKNSHLQWFNHCVEELHSRFDLCLYPATQVHGNTQHNVNEKMRRVRCKRVFAGFNANTYRAACESYGNERDIPSGIRWSSPDVIWFINGSKLLYDSAMKVYMDQLQAMKHAICVTQNIAFPLYEKRRLEIERANGGFEIVCVTLKKER
ncbi:hypothetical protein CANCADRAFT_72595 [Tortispora caseinolytica NRRL Y-17796]|uniref:Methyltransferase domain-containing protein n=1 Tax=Tortispora caseinolytica NRRL Y-17796 TaxID=767744 RepID=A0A1E4TIE9_9ASCO|nr:hypothetical protein CANCADRAFT_72595 [Tortispora caseinolytica NRRL Y-17796]